ncbi:hypothetical protein OKA04_06605 [Luteolibacter flavescens]|uniref:Uncharacterized protein n=1 Tax=Luteolibacter flavescens TaxID=1859460 RepID=A0ABT3FLD2_9BACT|nr:hypothetical protein [Luteolibacter flavescens]MCW1884396.1 hypothetical protein [Luteolibacter flavescens]
MFCSWRKSPSAPCSCAFLLRGPLPELLNHLCCLGESTLVLRQQGLSLAKCTRFGLSVATRESGWQVLRDHLSGMETDTGRSFSLYLLANPDDRKPVIGIAETGRTLHASIRLDNHEWNSPVVANLVDHFEGVSLDCMESRRLGAGAWLDEWERPVADESAVCMEQACQILHECRELEVSVSARGNQGSARFEPSFVDSCGAVLRIADRGRRHVVHADVQDPGFRLFRTDRYGLRLCVEDQSGSTIR